MLLFADSVNPAMVKTKRFLSGTKFKAKRHHVIFSTLVSTARTVYLIMRMLFLTSILYFSISHVLFAETVSVAVASNALKAMQSIKPVFEKASGHQLAISSGSTGKLYAQIINGAPYDVFLAANVREPKHLDDDGMIVQGSRFTYAKGRLALCSTTMALDEEKAKTILSLGKFNRLAMANPKTAPYGQAAEAVLKKLKLLNQNRAKIIKGENISQALQFTASGNVDMGFVAVAQVWKNTSIDLKPCWYIGQSYYPPLEQQAVWLKRAAANPAAKAFVEFLQSEPAKKILSEDFGYGI